MDWVVPPFHGRHPVVLSVLIPWDLQLHFHSLMIQCPLRPYYKASSPKTHWLASLVLFGSPLPPTLQASVTPSFPYLSCLEYQYHRDGTTKFCQLSLHYSRLGSQLTLCADPGKTGSQAIWIQPNTSKWAEYSQIICKKKKDESPPRVRVPIWGQSGPWVYALISAL